MTCEEYLSNMKPGYIVDGGSEEHLVMHELSQRALKITMELNNKYHTKEEIILTGKEHQVLLYLLENGNQILPKEKIFEAVWNESFIHGDKTLIMHIGNLRKKLELNPNKPEIIETFRGIGYRLKR